MPSRLVAKPGESFTTITSLPILFPTSTTVVEHVRGRLVGADDLEQRLQVAPG